MNLEVCSGQQHAGTCQPSARTAPKPHAHKTKAPVPATDNTRVSNTATLTDNNLNVPSDNRAPSGRLTVALGVVLCCVALVISVQWFSEASRSLADLNRTHGAASETTGDLTSVSTVIKESNAIFRQ